MQRARGSIAPVPGEERWDKPTLSKEGEVETVGLISKYRRISAWERLMIVFGSDGPIVQCHRPVEYKTIIEESSKIRTRMRRFYFEATLLVMSLASSQGENHNKI